MEAKGPGTGFLPPGSGAPTMTALSPLTDINPSRSVRTGFPGPGLRRVGLLTATAALGLFIWIALPAHVRADDSTTTAPPAAVTTEAERLTETSLDEPGAPRYSGGGLSSETLEAGESGPASGNTYTVIDRAGVMETLNNRARKGDVEAQALLGAALRRGWPGKRDLFRALAWTRAAAEAGSFYGQANLAVHYWTGQGVERDPVRAERLAAEAAPRLAAAARAGSPEMMTFLAWMYARGVGLEKNPQQAVRWLERASALGYPPAQTNLAVAWLKGIGVRPDPVEAGRLLGLASLAGMARAQYLLGRLYEEGRGVPKDMDAADEWYSAAAAQGLETARKRLNR